MNKGNRYTAYRDHVMKYGKNAPYLYRRTRVSKAERERKFQAKFEELQEEAKRINNLAELPADLLNMCRMDAMDWFSKNFEPIEVMSLPKLKKTKRIKPRSDRGKKHHPQRKFKSLRHAAPEVRHVMNFEEQQHDLFVTMKLIEKLEAEEEMKKRRQSPSRIAEAKKANVERQRKVRQKQIHCRGITAEEKKRREIRLSKLPKDLKCVFCNCQKTSKQFVILTFQDGDHGICRICLDAIRIDKFDGNSELCRASFKCVRYSDLELVMKDA